MATKLYPIMLYFDNYDTFKLAKDEASETELVGKGWVHHGELGAKDADDNGVADTVDSLTIPELKAKLDELGVSYSSKATKDTLVDLYTTAMSKQPTPPLY